MTTFTDAKDKYKPGVPRVLVVDDEAEICQMVSMCLKHFGFRISCVANVADAVHLLDQVPFDAIVTDVMMPEEDGISFLGRVHLRFPDTPVILMTGYAQLQMAVDALKKGAFDFVHKPFDFDHMGKIVERAVRYAQLQRMEKNYHAELEETVILRTADLKNAMVELDFVKSELLKGASEKNEFMSTVSHEMRTLMTGVIGGLSLLEDQVTTADGKEYLETVSLSANRMVNLMDQMLTFGRGAGLAGKTARCNLVNLAANMKDVIAQCQQNFVGKGLSLTLHVTADVPHLIWTSKEQLNRLLAILLDNALKFTDQGGVTLELSHEDKGGEGVLLHISVTDSGCGIPPGMLKRIFEPFVQGDGSYNRRHGGVGLGLAIAEQNALFLDGKLWAEHVPEGGTRIKFSMKALAP